MMKINTMFICRACLGSGKEFLGAFMNSNPSHYGDYEEIWVAFKRCKGTGKTRNLKDVLQNIKDFGAKEYQSPIIKY